MQALNKKFERQGKERSHSVPKQYKGHTDWVLKSPTPVMMMADVDTEELGYAITHSTLSGT